MNRFASSWFRRFGLGLVPVVLVGLLGLAGPTKGQRDFSKVEIVTTELAQGIYMMVGDGGNLGVSVGDDGVFLIDDQYAPLTKKIQAAVAEVSDQPIRFVLNTHWHFDHTGGNENLGKEGTVIVAHGNVRKRMKAGQVIEAFDVTEPPAPHVALPVVTFEDAVTFHLNGDEIHAFHVPPAHTDGDSIVHFRGANVVHMGDLFFNGGFPFVDLSSGGSFDGMITAADRVLGMADADTKIIPGHGPLADRGDLAAYRDMLQGVRDAMAPLVKAGKTRDEVIAAKPLGAFDETWGKAFMPLDVFTGILFDSLSAP